MIPPGKVYGCSDMDVCKKILYFRKTLKIDKIKKGWKIYQLLKVEKEDGRDASRKPCIFYLIKLVLLPGHESPLPVPAVSLFLRAWVQEACLAAREGTLCASLALQGQPVQFTVYNVHCMQCTLNTYTVNCTMCTVYSVLCRVRIVQCIHCIILYSGICSSTQQRPKGVTRMLSLCLVNQRCLRGTPLLRLFWTKNP